MSKYFTKAQPMAKVQISDNIALLMKPHIDSDEELMVAIGMLSQMYAMNQKIHSKTFDIARFKEMMCAYIDKIMEAEE